MRLKKFLNEMSISKNTNISVLNADKWTYEVKIVLEDGLMFIFSAIFKRNTEEWDVSFEDAEGNYGMSQKREGAGLELFASLEKVMSDFIKKYNPENIVFSAESKEQSRVKLYGTLAKKLERFGYKSNKETNQRLNQVEYRFKRK
jgi:hypothetical protein